MYVHTIPAPWKKHGFLNEHGTRKEYVPAGANIIRTGGKKRQQKSDDNPQQEKSIYIAAGIAIVLLHTDSQNTPADNIIETPLPKYQRCS